MGGKLQPGEVFGVVTEFMPSGFWNQDYLVYGITLIGESYELWFGGKGEVAVTVVYPVEPTSFERLCDAAEAMPTYAVTATTGVYLDLLPPGWVRISGATHIQPGNGNPT